MMMMMTIMTDYDDGINNISEKGDDDHSDGSEKVITMKVQKVVISNILSTDQTMIPPHLSHHSDTKPILHFKF